MLVGYLAIVHPAFGALWLLPILFLSHLALCLGCAFIFSSANVFFRDTEHFQQIIMLAWFFLTPIIYPLSLALGVLHRFPAALQTLLFLNPMAGIVSGYRMAFQLEDPIAWSRLAISLGTAWVLLIVGAGIFQKLQYRFVDEM